MMCQQPLPDMVSMTASDRLTFRLRDVFPVKSILRRWWEFLAHRSELVVLKAFLYNRLAPNS